MNRTERRLARKRNPNVTAAGSSSGTAPAPDIASLFAFAFEQYGNGNVAQAKDVAKKILARDPNHAPTLNFLGVLAQDAGRSNVAAKLFGQAIAAAPSNPAFHYNLGLAYQALGRRAEASAHFASAMSCDLANPVSLVRDNVFVRRCLQRIETSWPRSLTLQEIFGEDGIESFVADNLFFQCVLLFGFAHDEHLERLLTALRLAVLREVVSQNADSLSFGGDVLMFLSALAQQCFSNGYIFSVGADELRAVQQLQDKQAINLQGSEAIDPLALIVIASYMPLHSLPMARAIADHAWPEFLAPLIVQQLLGPLEESKIRPSIHSLTEVDEASVAVQQQYEENPYPAWTVVRPVSATTLEQYLEKELLRGDLGRFAAVSIKNVLVAGCGTGRHSINVARSFPDANVLAVDISRASLGYAIRKTREMRIPNLEYAHADILRLESIGPQFDLIESIGVLHHLKDPAAGVRVLLSLLNPNGIIGIGLYSERARHAVVVARRHIADKGYRPTLEDMRACRQDLMQRARNWPSQSVVKFRDFFHAGGCRDLLFHVMEHRFTIAQIKALLNDNGLTLLGFEISPDLRAHFLEQFPGEDSLTDLDKWDLFEAAHPETFIGMYIFYAQKAD
jgi:SAM-dependent methyltransferase/tetratricopeptide (TPR) repeat protein